MLISHKYKFVFVKTKKTGGSSVELALSPLLEEGDYATILSPDEEKIRGERFKGIVRTTADRFNKEDYGLQNAAIYPHHGIHIIRKVLGDEIAGYRVFCVERNSWDKIVSGYFYSLNERNRRTNPPVAWGQEDFLNAIRTNQLGKFHDFPHYTYQGEIVVDEVIQYSEMEKGLNRLLLECGAPTINLSQFSAKAGIRPASKQEIYQKLFGGEAGIEAIDYVENRFRKEISMFDYQRPF